MDYQIKQFAERVRNKGLTEFLADLARIHARIKNLERENAECTTKNNALLSQRDMLVEALEKFMTFHQGHVLGTPELGHIVATGRAALAKVRQGGEG